MISTPTTVWNVWMLSNSHISFGLRAKLISKSWNYMRSIMDAGLNKKIFLKNSTKGKFLSKILKKLCWPPKIPCSSNQLNLRRAAEVRAKELSTLLKVKSKILLQIEVNAKGISKFPHKSTILGPQNQKVQKVKNFQRQSKNYQKVTFNRMSSWTVLQCTSTTKGAASKIGVEFKITQK